jgi:hypothetical protein
VNKEKMKVDFIDLIIEFLIVGLVDAVSFYYFVENGGKKI